VAGEVGLVGEAGTGGDLGGADAGVEEGAGLLDAHMVEVGVRRQAGGGAEGAQEGERADTDGLGQFVQ
jgi:hypothetical protein